MALTNFEAAERIYNMKDESLKNMLISCEEKIPFPSDNYEPKDRNGNIIMSVKRHIYTLTKEFRFFIIEPDGAVENDEDYSKILFVIKPSLLYPDGLVLNYEKLFKFLS